MSAELTKFWRSCVEILNVIPLSNTERLRWFCIHTRVLFPLVSPYFNQKDCIKFSDCHLHSGRLPACWQLFPCCSCGRSSCFSSYHLLPVEMFLKLTQNCELEWLKCRHVLFPFLQVLRIFGSISWCNVINRHKKVAQNVTELNISGVLLTSLKVTKGQLWKFCNEFLNLSWEWKRYTQFLFYCPLLTEDLCCSYAWGSLVFQWTDLLNTKHLQAVIM